MYHLPTYYKTLIKHLQHPLNKHWKNGFFCALSTLPDNCTSGKPHLALPGKPGWAPFVGFQVKMAFQEPWCRFAQVFPFATLLTVLFSTREFIVEDRKEKECFLKMIVFQ